MNAATSLELAVAVVANICCSMCSRTGNACALSERGGLVNLWVHTYAPHICCSMCSRSGNACTMPGGRFDTLSAHKSTEGLGMPANSQEGRFRVLRFRDFATLQVPTSSAPIHLLSAPYKAPTHPSQLPSHPPPAHSPSLMPRVPLPASPPLLPLTCATTGTSGLRSSSSRNSYLRARMRSA